MFRQEHYPGVHPKVHPRVQPQVHPGVLMYVYSLVLSRHHLPGDTTQPDPPQPPHSARAPRAARSPLLSRWDILHTRPPGHLYACPHNLRSQLDKRHAPPYETRIAPSLVLSRPLTRHSVGDQPPFRRHPPRRTPREYVSLPPCDALPCPCAPEARSRPAASGTPCLHVPEPHPLRHAPRQLGAPSSASAPAHAAHLPIPSPPRPPTLPFPIPSRRPANTTAEARLTA
ncbi:hypothetical protein B0H14DRAFT_3484625 [Mycena olivaceomarginata]|nr:hypothetical protein B0H14DRAFT_3484625 [Mycena olivaceomarginata]